MNPESGGGGGPRKATYADLEAVPPHKVAELVDGKLYVSPRPAFPHARAAGRIYRQLDGPFDQGLGGPGGWLLLLKPELHLGEDVLVPDIAGWRRERMPKMPQVVGFTLAPDWVCEVLSPSTAKLDREKKMKVYAHALRPGAGPRRALRSPRVGAGPALDEMSPRTVDASHVQDGGSRGRTRADHRSPRKSPWPAACWERSWHVRTP